MPNIQAEATVEVIQAEAMVEVIQAEAMVEVTQAMALVTLATVAEAEATLVAVGATVEEGIVAMAVAVVGHTMEFALGAALTLLKLSLHKLRIILTIEAMHFYLMLKN
ncbi:hypothetical protein VNO78_31699 [Psophocarpus tetragonolobus]|uniref:Uncharacterized protein n=1 Tax=Psophocarpus tetragonolobus TaxID=3891 RepID=A0AAN9X7Y2_PSOTE